MVHPLITAVANQLPAFLRQYGIPVTVTSIYRSPQKQAELYAKYLAGKMPYVVAKPGTSRHERGLAIDISVPGQYLKTLVSVMQALGFRWAGMKDPVHFDLPG